MPDSRDQVALVDDDASVRKSLKRLLSAFGFQVVTFADATSFLAHGPVDQWGCLVLDVRMPRMDGLALQKRLAEAGELAPIIFLTGHGDIPMSVSAVKAGAVDFLTKPVDQQVLIKAVREAIAVSSRRRGKQQDNADLRVRIASLTPRELDVLRRVIAGEKNKQIGHHLGISEKTVKVHRSRVMKKTGADSAVSLLRICQEAGIEPESDLLSGQGVSPDYPAKNGPG